MFIAIDEHGNRVYAEEATKNHIFYCQCCKEKVVLKQGNIKRWHFSHTQNTNCKYLSDKDYKSEWHIRMQDYFPKESQEYRFYDDVNKETHIADIYLEKDNVVLEFQHSPISKEEFRSRTLFHIKNGRKIVWLFDESSNNPEKNFGRFVPDSSVAANEGYRKNAFRWKHSARRELIKDFFKGIRGDKFGVFVFLGTEGDVFHRIVWMNEDAVNFSLFITSIQNVNNANCFFLSDTELCRQAVAKREAIPSYNYLTNQRYRRHKRL